MNGPLLTVIPPEVADTSTKVTKTFGIAEPSFESCSTESYGFSSDNEYQSDRSRMKKKRSICQVMTSTLKIAMNCDSSSSGDESSATAIPSSHKRRHLRPRPNKPTPSVVFPSVGSPLHRVANSPSPPSTESDSEGSSSAEDQRQKRVSFESYNAFKDEKLCNTKVAQLSTPAETASVGSTSGRSPSSPIGSSPDKGERKRRRSTSCSDENAQHKKRSKRDILLSKYTSNRTAMPAQRDTLRMTLNRCKVQKRKLLPENYATVLLDAAGPSTSSYQPSLIL